MTSSDASTVLVTGGLGFIGRHVSRYFQLRGRRTIGIGHGEADAEAGLSRWHRGDVSRQALEAIAEPIDLIVHCAGSGVVGDSFREPDAEFRKSVGAALEVLEFVRHKSARPRIVMLSSAAVYGIVEHLPIREEAPLNPISPYGKSKLTIERRCQEYAWDFGLEIAIIRLFSVFGSGLRKQLFWDACRKFSQQDGRFGGSGDERRDWLHVSDAVRLIDLAAAHASPMVPIVNGGSGASIRVRDALTRLRDLWWTSAPDLTFSGEARQGDPPGYEADIARARGFGWTPRQDFSDGLADYVAWARGALGS